MSAEYRSWLWLVIEGKIRVDNISRRDFAAAEHLAESMGIVPTYRHGPAQESGRAEEVIPELGAIALA